MAVEYFTGTTVNDQQEPEHYFHIKGKNGEIVAQSEGYTRQEDAMRGYHTLVNIMTTDVVRKLLSIMFEGWQLYEKSYDKSSKCHKRDKSECMTEAAGGDEKLGYLINLFDHWANDITEIAKHYGITPAADEPEETVEG